METIKGYDVIIHDGETCKQQITFAMLIVHGKEVTVEKNTVPH